MRTVVVALGVIALIGVAGCGSDDDSGGEIKAPAKESSSSSQPADASETGTNAGDLKACLDKKGVKVSKSGRSPYDPGALNVAVDIPSNEIAGVAYWKSDHFAYLYIAEGDPGSAEEKVKTSWKALGGDPKFITRRDNVIAALDDDKTPTDSELASLNACA